MRRSPTTKRVEPQGTVTIQSPQLTKPDARGKSETPQPDVASSQTSGDGDDRPMPNPPSPHIFHEQMLCSASRRDPSFHQYLSLGSGQRNEVAGEMGDPVSESRRDGQGEQDGTAQGTPRGGGRERGVGGGVPPSLLQLAQFLTARGQTQVLRASVVTGVRVAQPAQGRRGRRGK